jgi:hypothetical protein
MRVRRQTSIGKVDASAIEEFTAASDSDEHRRVTGFGDANGRDLPCFVRSPRYSLVGHLKWRTTGDIMA